MNRKPTDLKALPKPKLSATGYPFFATLAEAVSIFKSHDLPDANCEGCYVSPYKGKNGSDKIKFVFAIASGRTMTIDIDLNDLRCNPREYIEGMIERANAAYKQSKIEFDTQIFLMGPNRLSNAVTEVNRTRVH